MNELKINCLIVDDEPMALDLIETYVEKTPFLQLVGKCSSALEAMDIMQNIQVDLIFLDIQMPDLTGIEFSKTLKKETRIIFTTAFDNYAIEGYKVEALDYLLKPFNYTEFLIASKKALEWFTLLKQKHTQVAEPDYLFVKSEYKQLKINLQDILYIQGLKDYVKIWLQDQKRPILALMSLKSLEEKLPEAKFMRIHRSFIIALNKIKEVERSQVIIADERITISEQYKPKFQEYISSKLIN